MISFLNFDLVSVGIAVAAIGILGFVVFYNNRKSFTNRAFLAFSLASVLWSVANYLQYQSHAPEVSFWILRVVLFLGIWHSFSFFQFGYIFPEERKAMPRWYTLGYFPLVCAASIVTLFTPFVFSRIAQVAADGSLARVENGPLIPFAAFLILFSVVGGVVLLVRKTLASPPERKRQFAFVMWGMAATFLLLMAFNFILPAFLSLTRFIPFGAIFLLPFVALTFYSISRYHLLDVKVVSTEILAFVLSVATLLQVIISSTIPEVLLRSGVFTLTLIFSILLIRSVRTEIEQREELQRLNEQLDEKNKQLDQLSHFKSELLSLASHQIRSPLAAIKGFAQLIIDGAYGAVPDKVKDSLGKIQKSANELIGLINTLLDVRKVEEGKMEYQFARTDLNALVTSVFDALQPLAITKQLEFKFVSPGHEVWVNADAEKLKQVIQNLTDNAIKYTPTGFVHVELKEESGAATVAVSDSGYGVPATLIPFLFEEFVRDERVKKQVRGTGLGLFIARKIAEAHGGKIWAISAGEGKGSSFSVSVPTIK